MKLRPPTGFGKFLQGFGAVQNSDGTVTVTDNQALVTLMGLGFTAVENMGRLATPTLTAVLPDAAVSTYGTAQKLSPSDGYLSMMLQWLDIVWGGSFGSETATASLTAKFTDGTTGSELTKTATGTGTTVLSAAELRYFFGNGKDLSYVNVKVKSSLGAGSSAVVVAINAGALNL